MTTMTANPAMQETMEMAPAADMERMPEANQGIFSKIGEKISGIATDFGNRMRNTEPVKAGVMIASALAMGGTAAEAVIAPVEASAATSWTVLGGDPVVPGGVHSRADFVRLITSGKGQTTMKYAGLGKKERNAITLATRMGEERHCAMPYGEHFERMSYGINGTSVDKDVTFLDPDFVGGAAPAFCVDAKVDLNKDGKVDEVVHIKVPEACGNIALAGRTPVTHPKHHPKPHPKKVAPVYVAKEAITETGDLFPHTPTDTFQALVKCRQYGKTVTNNVIINMGPHGEPVFALKCNVGSKVTAKEGPTLGPDFWINKTNLFQKQTVRKKGNLFTFKDQEVAAGKPHQPTCEETQPKEKCVPKDGTQGPGAGTPGQPGGPGAGGEPNPSQNSVACYDIATSTDGDMNPATEGAPMWGTAKDQNDNCVGPATAA